MMFSIEDFLSKRDEIHSKLRIWWDLMKKPLMENLFLQCRRRSQPIHEDLIWKGLQN